MILLILIVIVGTCYAPRPPGISPAEQRPAQRQDQQGQQGSQHGHPLSGGHSGLSVSIGRSSSRKRFILIAASPLCRHRDRLGSTSSSIIPLAASYLLWHEMHIDA